MYIPNSLFLVDSLTWIVIINSLLTSVLITFANNLDPDQAQQNVGHDLDPNCLVLYWYSRKIILEKATTKKTDFEKISADDKIMTNYLVGKTSQWIEMEGAICTCMFHA